MTNPSFPHIAIQRQRGVTMVELLVAMTLMILVTLATVSLYSVTSSTSKTVDSTQELNDNARYAFDMIGQAIRIAGYQEYMPNNADIPRYGGKIYPVVCTSATAPCPVLGFNNSKVASPSSVTDFGATNNGGYNNSDTLAVTFFGSSLPSDPATADGTVLDCQGVAQPTVLVPGDLAYSLFWVTTSTGGEPELSCISRGTAGARNAQSIVRGVESFQVMYGIDTGGGSLTASSVPERWVSAQDVTDWNTVRAVRVGLILRGAAGSAPEATGDLYPLGKDFTGTSTETGLKFTPPTDRRLRRQYSATFMMRNSL